MTLIWMMCASLLDVDSFSVY